MAKTLWKGCVILLLCRDVSDILKLCIGFDIEENIFFFFFFLQNYDLLKLRNYSGFDLFMMTRLYSQLFNRFFSN